MYNRCISTPQYVGVARSKGADGEEDAEARAPAVPALKPTGLRMSWFPPLGRIPLTGAGRGPGGPGRGTEELLAPIGLSRTNELFSQNGPKMSGNGISVIVHLSPLSS